MCQLYMFSFTKEEEYFPLQINVFLASNSIIQAAGVGGWSRSYFCLWMIILLIMNDYTTPPLVPYLDPRPPLPQSPNPEAMHHQNDKNYDKIMSDCVPLCREISWIERWTRWALSIHSRLSTPCEHPLSPAPAPGLASVSVYWNANCDGATCVQWQHCNVAQHLNLHFFSKIHNMHHRSHEFSIMCGHFSKVQSLYRIDNIKMRK